MSGILGSGRTQVLGIQDFFLRNTLGAREKWGEIIFSTKKPRSSVVKISQLSSF